MSDIQFFHYDAFDEASRQVREDPNYFKPTGPIEFCHYEAFAEASRQVQRKMANLLESFERDRGGAELPNPQQTR
jgi:hypothetical protein